MKQLLLSLIVLCCAFFPSAAQKSSFEYLQYHGHARKGIVQLPDFSVQLKRTYKSERSEFKNPSKLFVISDIEGQYDYFKQILQAAGVMDKSFKWTFGKGALVVVGDVFDRGNQVAECLWLIYHLEEEAKKEGGRVHYILGNHEVMNMSGDHRYVHPRYMELAKQKAVPYNDFYSQQTELGRWLRTKNIMEKIGDHLFVHGGVSQNMNALDQTIDSINGVARMYYDQPAESMPPLEQLLLLDDGPLWYRGYFTNPPASRDQVDSTLKQFRVKKIIIGHTPVEHISTFYDGKVINVDVPHAKGVSEGLLIQDKKYYRVNLQGQKEQLMEGERKVVDTKED